MNYVEVTVVKVTSTQVHVQSPFYAGGEVVRFNQDGRTRFSPGDRLDTISYAERQAHIARNKQLREVATKVAGITAERGVNYLWGKDGLEREIARLQDLLNSAKSQLEQIAK